MCPISLSVIRGYSFGSTFGVAAAAEKLISSLAVAPHMSPVQIRAFDFMDVLRLSKPKSAPHCCSEVLDHASQLLSHPETRRSRLFPTASPSALRRGQCLHRR